MARALTEIADEEGLSKYWLNDAVTIRYLPQTRNRGERRIYGNHRAGFIAAAHRNCASGIRVGVRYTRNYGTGISFGRVF